VPTDSMHVRTASEVMLCVSKAPSLPAYQAALIVADPAQTKGIWQTDQTPQRQTSES
jgi:hypothetical protein